MSSRNNIYKLDSVMFYFDRVKEKASKILMDDVIFCNKGQLERINNRAEASNVCINCGDCKFCFCFPAVN